MEPQTEGVLRGKALGLPAVFLGLAMVLWLWPSRSPEPRQRVATSVGALSTGEGLYRTSAENGAQMGLEGVQIYQSSEGRRWQLKAEAAELHTEENYCFFRRPEGQFFAAKTGNWLKAESRFGRSYTDTESVDMEGEVVVLSRLGYRFELEHLQYDGKRQEFRSEDPVYLRGPDPAKPLTMVRGQGFRGDVDSERFRILRNVVAQRRVLKPGHPPKWLRITSRSGEFFANDHRTIFQKDVHAELPELAIRADQIELETLPEGESLHASGKVELQSGDRRGFASNAYLALDRGHIELVGDARVKTTDGEVRGSRIVLNSDDDLVEVHNAQGRQESVSGNSGEKKRPGETRTLQ